MDYKKIYESNKLNESKYPNAQKNFNDFINKLQAFLDSNSGMGLEVVDGHLGLGGAFITIEQRDENGKIPEDGLVSWMSCDEEELYRKINGEEE